MKIKDMIGITVGAVLLGRVVLPAIGAIGGGISKATQTLVAGGFMGNVASKVKFLK